MDAKRRQLGQRLQVVIQRLLRLPALAAAAEIADGHRRLGIDGKANRARVGVRFAIDPMYCLEDRVGLGHLAQRLALGHASRLEPQRTELAPQAAFEATASGA